MKSYLILFVLLSSLEMFSQVGINTTDPQQELHITGAAANVRVDGLNSANNLDNLGTDSTTRVFVDANGDLMLGTSSQTIEILVDEGNYIEDDHYSENTLTQTGAGSGFSPLGLPNTAIADPTFTLTGEAIVEVNYSISWSIRKSSQRRVEDKDARIVQTALYFKNTVSGLIEGGLVGLNGQFYTNGNKNRGAHQNFQNTATDYVELPAGTYVALFVAQVAVSNAAATGSIKFYLGDGTSDELQIIAYYYE